MARSRLEWRFERWLWRFRLVAIVLMLMSLLSAADACLCGALEVRAELKPLALSAWFAAGGPGERRQL